MSFISFCDWLQIFGIVCRDHDDDSGQASLESTGVHAETGKVSADMIAQSPEPTSEPLPEVTPPQRSFVPIPAPRPHLPVETSQLNNKNHSASITSEPTETCTETKNDDKNSDSDPEMSAPPRPGILLILS